MSGWRDRHTLETAPSTGHNHTAASGGLLLALINRQAARTAAPPAPHTTTQQPPRPPGPSWGRGGHQPGAWQLRQLAAGVAGAAGVGGVVTRPGLAAATGARLPPCSASTDLQHAAAAAEHNNKHNTETHNSRPALGRGPAAWCLCGGQPHLSDVTRPGLPSPGWTHYR